MSDFELEYPYTDRWGRGYLVVNGEGRNTVILYNSHADRSSTSYARYLMSVHLGRFLREDEHVDHKDDDKTRDVLDNLQILTLKQNNAKAASRRGLLVSEIECPECHKVFHRRKGLTQAIPCKEGQVTCCSRKCSGSFRSRGLTEEERRDISVNSLIRVIREH